MKTGKKGFTLVVAIFIVLVFSVIAVVAASLMSSDSIGVVKDINGIRALHLAEAGIRYTIVSSLENDTDWSNNTGFAKILSPGYFTISYSYQSKNSLVVQSVGVVNGISRTVSANMTRSISLSPFGFGLYAGNQGGGPLTIQNTAIIDGDFYYNGDVTMKNYAQLINGTMYSNSLTLQNSATCASWETLPDPPVPPPTFTSTYYDGLLAETNKTATSSLSMSSGTKYLSGGTYYYKSITLSGSAQIVGPGTLVATTGNLIVQNTASIGNNVRLIIKGTSTFKNSAAVGNSSEVISNGSITLQNSQNFPRDNLLFTYGDISFDNTAYFYGSILAPSGEMVSVNSTKFRGIIYGKEIDLQNSTNLRGSVVVDEVGYFSNSATVTYDPDVFPSNWPQGLESESTTASGLTVTNWHEVY